MSLKLNRRAQISTHTIVATGTASDPLTIDGYAMGMVYLPSTFDGTTVTFTCCDTYGGTYVTLKDSAGNAVSITTAASQCFALPEALFGTPYAKLVAGSTQNTTDTVFAMSLKA